MVVAIYDAAGTLVLFMDGPEDQVELNVPPGGRFEETTLQRMARMDESRATPEPPP